MLPLTETWFHCLHNTQYHTKPKGIEGGGGGGEGPFPHKHKTDVNTLCNFTQSPLSLAGKKKGVSPLESGTSHILILKKLSPLNNAVREAAVCKLRIEDMGRASSTHPPGGHRDPVGNAPRKLLHTVPKNKER